MGRVALDAPGAPGLVEEWAEQPNGLGLRFSIFMPRQREWLGDGTLDWFWPLAERLGIPVMLYPGPDRELIETVGRVAAKHEGLRLSIDHLAVGPYDIYDEDAFAHLDWLLALAALPNVAMKASAMPEYSTAPYPYRNLHPFLERTVEAFGPERVFWGTDLPRLQSPYREAVTMFTEGMEWLSESELDLIMGTAVCNWHGWAVPSLTLPGDGSRRA
jgi:predicted TIM-barrel fold metal-dependent hydrolase